MDEPEIIESLKLSALLPDVPDNRPIAEILGECAALALVDSFVLQGETVPPSSL